jgi:8-amino-7-oxononanoate synthase
VLNTWFEKKLQERESNDLLRKLSTTNGLVDFTSNDYLGLASSKELFQNISDKVERLGLNQNGAAGSRLLSGNSKYAEQMEAKLAGIFKSEAALIFNSGYAANLSVLSSIPQRGDTIIYDDLAHACIKDGARLSLAKRFSFRHNDLADLESKLKRAEGKVFVAVESIYSMDGDQCPLEELVKVAERYNASVILDEAHSTGVVGKNGSGLAVSLGLESRIDVRVYTFGKAMGVHGACVAGSNSLKQYLINFARPFIYTTALPQHSLISIDCAFEYVLRNEHLQQNLTEKINLFLETIQGFENRVISRSAIQTALFPGNKNARRAASVLQTKGFDVRPILSPTVPEGSERLRICLHTFNTMAEIENLCEELKRLTINDYD